MLRRISALVLVLGLMLVPAVGRAKQRVDPPNAKRLSAPYRSVDVRPVSTLATPDRSAAVRIDPDDTPRHLEPVDDTTLPGPPDVADSGSLRGPPLR